VAEVTRSGVYARVSSEEQAKNSSIGDQVSHGQNAARLRGFGQPGIYSDEGVTGTTANRPAWQRLLADCRAGLIDVVLVTKWDRLARNALVGLEIAAQLEDLGVRLVVIEADFDTGTPSGKMMRHMLVGFAAFDRDTLVERMGRGQHAMAERGGWPGGKQAPYGYKAVGGGRDNRLVICEEEAAVLRQIVNWVVDDQLTTGQVAQRLNAAGTLTRKGRRWTHQNLRRHLTERKLVGEILWGRLEKTYRSSRATGKYGPTVTIFCEPIISEERFAALQTAMSLRTRGTNKPRQIYPLSGRLICFCGEPFGGSYRADRDLRQYRCRAAKWTAAGEPPCSARRICADWIEGVVWEQILALLAKPERLLSTVEDYVALRAGQVEVERDESADVQANIVKLERALSRALMSSYMEDEPDAHDAVIAQIRVELDQARARQELLVSWKQESSERSARMRDIWSLAEVAVQRLGAMTLEQRQQVMALLDVRVTVLEARVEGPARGGFMGGLGPAQPRVRIEGSVPHATLLDMIVEPGYPRALSTPPVAPPPR
jgi:DNA invertase Pin-like site-specific DNA recombinase